MPYPILKLSYGLQRRIRSLATRKELYDLQLAIGLEKNYLLPIQMCTTYDKEALYLQNNSGNLDLSTYPQFFGLQGAIDWENENLTLVKTSLHMTYLQELDFDHPIFNYLFIDCYSISFWYGTVLNPTILRKFVQHCNTKAIVSFYADDGTISDINLPLICDIFENVQKVSLTSPDYAYNRWILDILQFRRLNLKEFSIGGRFKELFSFEPEEVSQLFLAQDTEFLMVLYCSNPPQDAVELIRQKLGTHLKEFNYKSGHNDGVLHIKLGEAHSVIRLWFQVGPKTPRALEDVYHCPI